MRNIIISIFLLAVFVSGLQGGEKIFSEEYKLRGRPANLEVESGPYGTDVFLNIGARKNLSYFTPGENLFPKMFVKDDGYSVTWISYKKNNVKLNFYDSESEHGRMIVSGNFDFISSDTSVVYNKGKPCFVIFRAIKGNDNEDIFIHKINSGLTARITKTDGNENRIIVENNELDGKNSFIMNTQTLDHEYTYKIDVVELTSDLKEKNEIVRTTTGDRTAFNEEELNTIIAIGDSVTWGKMRMYDLVDSYNPDLTYWAKASQYFNENYGQTYTVNLGVNKDSSLQGLERMDEDLKYRKGYFFFVLFGTNDVTSGTFSSNSTTQNIQRILENGRNNYGMFPIVSTVPPQRLYIQGVQFFKEETEKLNEKIKIMADANNFNYIDSYEAFFNQVENWVDMLEDIKGNHPSPDGHQVMADLVTPIILDLIPEMPSNVNFSSASGGSSFNVSCTANNEFDFSHYNVKFGFSPSNLNREMTFSSNDFSIYFYPFNISQNKTVYFKIQSVDKDGNGSSFTKTYSVYLN